MSDVERRKADRLRVLEAVYDRSDARDWVFVDGGQLAEDLMFTDNYFSSIVRYLEGRGWVRGAWDMGDGVDVQITVSGIDTVESMRSNPDQETADLASHNQTMIFLGDVTNSPMAQAGGDVTQWMSVTEWPTVDMSAFFGSLTMPTEGQQRLKAILDDQRRHTAATAASLDRLVEWSQQVSGAVPDMRQRLEKWLGTASSRVTFADVLEAQAALQRALGHDAEEPAETDSDERIDVRGVVDAVDLAAREARTAPGESRLQRAAAVIAIAQGLFFFATQVPPEARQALIRYATTLLMWARQLGG